jgi:hypothetical protein
LHQRNDAADDGAGHQQIAQPMVLLLGPNGLSKALRRVGEARACSMCGSASALLSTFRKPFGGDGELCCRGFQGTAQAFGRMLQRWAGVLADVARSVERVFGDFVDVAIEHGSTRTATAHDKHLHALIVHPSAGWKGRFYVLEEGTRRGVLVKDDYAAVGMILAATFVALTCARGGATENSAASLVSIGASRNQRIRAAATGPATRDKSASDAL